MELDEKKREKALIKAEKLANDFDPKRAEEFASKHQTQKWYDDFILLYRMITDKDYKLTKKTYLVIAGALAYVVLPLDVVPDFIPSLYGYF